MTVPQDTPLGRQEVAALLGVQVGTVRQWQRRGVMPPAELTVSGLPTWWRSTIIDWALKRHGLDGVVN